MGMGIGDWGLGIGDWAQSPIPNPQSPIPNPHFNIIYFISLNIFNKKKGECIIYSKMTKNINYIKNDYPREIKCNEKNKRRI